VPCKCENLLLVYISVSGGNWIHVIQPTVCHWWWMKYCKLSAVYELTSQNLQGLLNVILTVWHSIWSHHSVAGVTTLQIGSIAGRCRRCFSARRHLDWLWVHPTSYSVVLGVLCLGQSWCGSIRLFPLYSFVALTGTTAYLYVHMGAGIVQLVQWLGYWLDDTRFESWQG